MSMLLRMALRNLGLHKAKTIIIGFLVFLGVFLSFIGTNLITTMTENIGRSFAENFTGDILIRTSDQMAGVFGASEAEAASGIPVLKTLDNFAEIYSLVSELPEAEAVTSTYSAYVMPNLAEMGMDFSLVFGIEPESYMKVFPGTRILEGRMLQPGEEGMILHVKTRDKFQESFKVDLVPGTELQLNNFGEGGFKIRTVPIVGIFEFESRNDRLFTPSLLDIQTVRSLFGKVTVSAADINIRPDAIVLLGDFNEEDLFGEDEMITDAGSGVAVDVESILGPKPEGVPEADISTGSWSFILVKLKEGVSADQVIASLNEIFKAKEWKAFAQGWSDSATPDSRLFLAVNILLSVIVLLLALVTVIVIMNTLVASVMERTNELGTMRALGARKSFVARMIISETFIVVFASGFLAIFVGSVVMGLLSLAAIPADTDFLRALFGGTVFQPGIQPGSIIGSIILMSFIAGVSWIFPVLMAVKVTPLKAMTLE